ncbi:MAG: molybdenum cofactor synthesis domain-containing protein [Thermoactinomyces sp.]
MPGRIVAVCKSEQKGVKKQNVRRGLLIASKGLQGDAHAGDWHRQISLLGIESIQKMRELGADVKPGDFAENLTTQGINLVKFPVGTKLKTGESLIEITQIGKKCHSHCTIHKQVGNCIMPKEGVFARVLKGGPVAENDEISVWKGITVGIVTASDKGSRGEREDKSAEEIRNLVQRINGEVIDYRVLPDDREILAQAMREMADQRGVLLLFTTGGTGFSPRDITPEATRDVIEREVPGLPEAMRQESCKATPRAMLSRAIAGIRGKCLIINLPGSPKGVRECLEVILPVLPHAIEILSGTGGECGQSV